jgi:CRISPR-associated protein Csm1
MTLYGWAVPSSLSSDYARHFDAAGISVFEQFKFVTALAHCIEQRPGREDLLLVGGDIPGIQAMRYTITSRGVAKSLRGRSLYLQLLCDAVVRLLLERFRLPAANVLVNAGGNNARI